MKIFHIILCATIITALRIPNIDDSECDDAEVNTKFPSQGFHRNGDLVPIVYPDDNILAQNRPNNGESNVKKDVKTKQISSSSSRIPQRQSGNQQGSLPPLVGSQIFDDPVSPINNQHNKQISSQNNHGSSVPKINHPFGAHMTIAQNIMHAMQELALDLQSTTIYPINTIQSPYSISILMGLLTLGSNGKTKHQLTVGQHFRNDEIDDIHEGYRQLSSSILQNGRGVTFNSATRMFASKDISDVGIFRSFTNDAFYYYSARLQVEDFAGKPNEAMRNINNWVNKETNGKIEKILFSPLRQDTKLIVANSVYFNGAWEVPFNPDFTFNRTFKSGFRNITMPFMVSEMPIAHISAPEINADIISLFYKGSEFAMFFILPKGNSDLEILKNIEYRLDAAYLEPLISKMNRIEASVRIPRMRLRFRSFLKPGFIDLGMSSMFNPLEADFTKISNTKPLYIENIIHETAMEITEKGTEAAAVTIVSLDRSGGKKSFTVERPCITFVRDLKNKVNLFWGRIFEPEPIF